MSPERRRKAKFYIRLATSPPVDTLGAKQRDALVRETKQVVFPLFSSKGSAEHNAYVDREIVAALKKAQDWLSGALPKLAGGYSVAVPKRTPTVNPDFLNPMEDRTVMLMEIGKSEDGVLRDAIKFLTSDTLPYKQCAKCQKIFVSDDLRMKFCSAACRRKSQSSANNPARREYLRKWAAQYRRERRKQQTTQQTAA